MRIIICQWIISKQIEAKQKKKRGRKLKTKILRAFDIRVERKFILKTVFLVCSFPRNYSNGIQWDSTSNILTCTHTLSYTYNTYIKGNYLL